MSDFFIKLLGMANLILEHFYQKGRLFFENKTLKTNCLGQLL